MIKESRYILRRILIGVGIVLVLGFIRSGKVNALTSLEMYNNQISPSIPTYCENKKKILTTSQFFINLQYPNFDISYNDPPSPSRSLVLFCFDTDITDFNYGSNLSNYVNSFSTRKVFQYKTRSWSEITSAYGPISNGLNFVLTGTTTCPYPNEFGCLIWNNSSYGDYITQGTVMYSDFDKVRSNDIIYYDSSISFGSSTIQSLQPLKVNQDAYIVAYIFKPKFSNFNTDSYIYQYKVGKNGNWLNISQNEEQITINNNNNIYFRVLDKSDNSVVDSRNYTITDIGNLNNNLNYYINFSSDYETLQSSNIISKYIVNINYSPKSSVLKYQYQFVLNGSSLDNNNWNSLEPETFSYNFETLQNGFLYARILDSDNNVLANNNFTVTEIGKFAINNNNNKNNNFFDKINSSINFGGPISGIINIPINLIRVLSTAIATNTCSDYNLGSLWGTNLVIPCVNIKQHLGNSLYTTIDLICACVMIYYIFKMFGELYTNLLFMQKNPIQDLGKRGD